MAPDRVAVDGRPPPPVRPSIWPSRGLPRRCRVAQDDDGIGMSHERGVRGRPGHPRIVGDLDDRAGRRAGTWGSAAVKLARVQVSLRQR